MGPTTNKRCALCVLPSTFPGIRLDEQGVCNFCRDYVPLVRDHSGEQQLVRIFEEVKNRNLQYDCIVPVSGGKDSTYVLYLIRTKFGLNPLTITLDNYFRSPQADSNLRRALKLMDVDHLMITPRWSLFRKLYERFLDNEGKGRFTSEFCIPCNIAIWTAVNRIADRYGVPVVYGGVRDVESSPAELFGFSTEYFEGIAREVLSESEIREFAPYPMDYRNASMADERGVVSIFDYVYWDRQEEQTALRAMGWRKGRHSAGGIHIDCELHGLCNYFHKRRWGSVRTALHYSKMIRRGDMTRAEAMRFLKREEVEDAEPILRQFRERLASEA